MEVLLGLIILAIIGLSWSLIEAQLFYVKKINLKNSKVKDKVTIVFLSDLHYGNYYYPSRLKKIVKCVNELTPDLLIFGGDFLDIRKNAEVNEEHLKETFSVLEELKAKCGKFTVLGNHEYYLGNNMPLILEQFEKNHINLLKNATQVIRIGKDTVSLHGVDDLLEGKVDITKLKIYKDNLNIAISHNPDFFEEVSLDFDIGLSGHTHGGQVTLFGLYAPVTESKYSQKYVHTINKKGEAAIITSKGLGCSLLPIRFFAVPQIIELNIMKNE